MTVAFIDVPGSRLPTVDAPLDFTASSDVAAVSVGFGSLRVEERVYRDGVFLWPYLQSTKTGSAFRIVRDGGWPSDPQVYVDELSTSTPTGYDVLADIDFTALPTTPGNTATANTLVPFTETLGGLAFSAVNNTHGAFGEGTPPFSQNVNGRGFRVVGIGSTFMRSNGSASYFVTDVRSLPGYVAGREYGCLAVIDYDIALQHPESMAYVGCFDPNPYYPGYFGWFTQANDSGFGCGVTPLGDLGYPNQYRPVVTGPVVGDSPVTDVPARSTTQLQRFISAHSYVVGTLRSAPGYAEGVAGPYSGAQPVIEHLLNVGGIQTMWAGSMDNLRWGVCWKGRVEYRNQQYCYVKRMFFYQSKG